MKKILLLLLVVFVITSCDVEIITNQNGLDSYIVNSVYTKTDKDNPKYCRYYINTGHDYLNISDDIFISDSIGKFSIADTIVLVPMKKSEYRKFIKK